MLVGPGASPENELVSTPPLNSRIGSAVPWKARTGTGRLGAQPSGIWIPFTGAKAANVSARSQASSDVMNAPIDNPVA